MASSSEGGRGGKPPASSSIEDKLAVTPAEGKSVKKKKVVRMSEEQIASYLSSKKTDPVPPIPGPRRLIDALSKEFVASLPQEAQDGLAAMDLHLFNEGIAEINAADDDLAREADDVRRQYMEKGYMEYEVNEDQYVPARAPPPPAPGRRRRRPGVSRKSGTTKRIN